MSVKQLTELSTNRVVRLDNVSCPYCGEFLSESSSTKEHVIGRRFVPKGSLDGMWNLIVRACKECNTEKSILENDISAITQAGRYWFGGSAPVNGELNEARRKAQNCKSIRTGKPVLHSQEQIKINLPFSPTATFSFNMVAPPQIDQDRIYHLARMQMMAFFYFITYNQETKLGGFWPEGFYMVSETHHGDWGNMLHRSFMNSVLDWQPSWIGITAKGYFKSIIRRHPNAECWSWALEWNSNYRVIGFFGDKDVSQKLLDDFEKPHVSNSQTVDGEPIRFRQDVPLTNNEDNLFFWKEETL